MDKVIQIGNKRFRLFIDEKTILEKVQALAARLNEDYRGKKPLFLSILNGSFMFAADLFKHLTIECSISFVKLASYRGTRSTGQVLTLLGLDETITGRHVVILEDIVDTGATLAELLPSLHEQHPRSLKVATFLLKPNALKHRLDIEYTGMEIPNEFIVGYGLDYDGLGRNLRAIYQIVE